MIDSIPSFDFPSVANKTVTARFDGGDITSNAGALLVSAADDRIGLTRAIAASIQDKRQTSKISHDLETLIKERVFAIACGYEDVNDLDCLRSDPALKVGCGRAPRSDADLASQPTISRLENSVSKKDLLRMGISLAEQVVARLPDNTKKVILDIDEMEDPCHGQQEFEIFNAHYDSHCYLPLLLFVTDETGRQRTMAVVLRSGKSGCRGVRGLLKRAVKLIRARFPNIGIELRADGGYGNDQVLRCCDKLSIDYTLGLPGNKRLHHLSTATQMDVCIKYSQTKYQPDHPVCREFAAIDYRAGSWDKSRRVIVKAEITESAFGDVKLNPRFVVTNRDFKSPEAGYAHYCARGDIENRIKEFNLDVSGGRTSCHRFLANQFRVLMHAGACVLMNVIQEAAQTTSLVKAQMGTIRLRLLKIGARIVESTRRVWIHMSSSCPDQEVWGKVYEVLTG
jgi:hypothetical protein